MFGSPTYNNDRRGFQGHYLSRGVSPKTTSYRPIPRLMNQAIGQFAINRENDDLNISDFINEIQNQIKRLSLTFSFQFSSEPPLIQATSFLTQAVDILIGEQRSIGLKSPKGSEGSRDKTEYDDRGYVERNRKIKEELDKAKETTKNLNRYEQLLKKKEEKVEEDKNKLKNERQSVRELEENLRNALNRFESQEKS